MCEKLSKNPQFIQKFTFGNFTSYTIHNFKVSFFTKFTFFKVSFFTKFTFFKHQISGKYDLFSVIFHHYSFFSIFVPKNDFEMFEIDLHERFQSVFKTYAISQVLGWKSRHGSAKQRLTSFLRNCLSAACHTQQYLTK